MCVPCDVYFGVRRQFVLFMSAWAAFKIVAARLAARAAFKIVACFFYNGNSKVCLWKIFASFDFPCLKN